MMTVANWAALLLDQVDIPPAPAALRGVVRVFLAILIGVLVTYIVIEQVGTFRRRRRNRE